MRKKPSEPNLQDTLEHILTICAVYECSTDKIGRIEQFVKHILEQFKLEKKGKENANSNVSSKVRSSRKRTS